MTETEKAIRDFCGHHADWWPSTTQVQEMLALAQPEQEPVAWGVFESNLHDMFFTQSEAQEMAKLKGTHAEVRPLYATPPQRKPLTNGEIYTAYITATNQTLRATDERLAFAFARAIEAAHGIKG